MLKVLVWTLLALLACLGLIQAFSWAAIRCTRKGNPSYKVIPIGGEGRGTGDQMSLLYACMQWEANPGRQVYVLYDAGLTEEQARACEQLVGATGALFVRSPKELDALLRR